MTDPSGHLDLDALADVLAGEHDDAHARSCDRCAALLDELAEAQAATSAALAALPAPPLPPGLPLRLTRALQEERRRELAVVRPSRRRPAAWLPGVAASVALVLAGAVGWTALGPSGGQDAGTSAESAAGGAGDTSADQGPGLESAAEPAAPPTGTDWAEQAARPAAVARLLATADPSRSSDAALADGELARLRDPAALAACLRGLPAGADDVLALDFAQYAGRPAVAVLQPAGADQVRLTVVGSGCSADDPQLLDGAVLPRP